MERLWWGRAEDAIVRGLVFVVGDAVVAFPFQPLRLPTRSTGTENVVGGVLLEAF